MLRRSRELPARGAGEQGGAGKAAGFATL